MKMAELIQKLVELQEVLRDVYFLEKENRELPLPLKKRKRLFEPRQRELEEKEEVFAENTARIATLEEEMAGNIDAQNALEEKMKVIKTQKEYDALATEKDFLLKAAQDYSLEQSALQEKVQNSEVDIATLKEANGTEEEAINALEAEINEKIAVNDGKIAEILKVKERMAAGIDPLVLRQFEKILNHKEGVGIVSVVEGSCNGCHMAVPPQLICELHSYNRIVNCLHCSRILYIDTAV